MADEDALFAEFMGEINSAVAAAPEEDPLEVASVGENEDAVAASAAGEAGGNELDDTSKRKGDGKVRQAAHVSPKYRKMKKHNQPIIYHSRI